MPVGPVDIDKGVADADISQLELDGVVYRLVAWTTGSEIRTRLYSIHEQGQITLLFDKRPASAAANHTFDSVRCVHTGDQIFHVLWLDYDTVGGTYELDGAWFDVGNSDTVTTWTGMSATNIDDAGLYDAKQIENAQGSSEYMLAWASSATEVAVRRVSGNTFGDFEWSTVVTTTHADRVLAVHGDAMATADNGGCLIVFQDTDNDLCAVALDFDDGTAGSIETIRADTDAEYTAVGLCLASLPASPTVTRVAVIAEFYEDLTPSASGGEESYVRSLFCAEVLSADGTTNGSGHVVRNLNLLSKPYSYADAEGDMHVYCGVGYKSCRLDADWQESIGLICDMGYQHWAESANTIRPRPVAQYPHLNINAEPHGSCPEAGSLPIALLDIGRRMNHLSNWVPGPTWLCDTRKSRTVVWPGWSRIEEETKQVVEDPVDYGSRLSPSGATVEEITHYLEDPWTVNRDSLDPPQPSVNFHGANPLTLYNHCLVQRELLVSGGTPHLYDGVAIVELGFPWAPEIVEVIDDAGGSVIGAGDYSYAAVYEWTDNKGQLHRSGYGRPYAYTAPGGQGATIRVRTMTVGNKEADWIYPRSGSITIAVYRTNPSEPDVYRRLYGVDLAGFTAADTPRNDPTVWMVEITDNVSELAHAQGLASPAPFIDGGDPTFYTELPPTCPPAAHAVANWQNRAWLASSEERELWYSKENLPTAATGRIAPEFHPALRFSLDGIDGDVMAMHPMADDLIIFTRDDIYALSGFGPDALGAGAQYNLQTLHKGIGCIEPRSVVEVPDGIVFQSYKGLHLLDRGGSVNYEAIGAPPEDLIRTGGNVRAAVYLPDRHQVAFVINGDVADEPLVAKWDFLMKQWYTARLEPPNTTTWLSSTAGGVAWRGNERDASLAVLCQGNLLLERGKDDATPFVDENDVGSSVPVLLDVESGWISLAQLGGEKRLYEIGIHISDSADALYAELDVDTDGEYSPASPEDHRWGVVNTTAAPNYCRLRPTTQKLTSFRLRLYEPSMTAAADVKLIGITARVGVRRGSRRVADAQIGRRS